MEKLYEQGKVKAIGVSNFTEEHLENLMKEAKITPAVNQVEYHPKNAQKKLLEYCETHGIQMEAWRRLEEGICWKMKRLNKLLIDTEKHRHRFNPLVPGNKSCYDSEVDYPGADHRQRPGV